MGLILVSHRKVFYKGAIVISADKIGRGLVVDLLELNHLDGEIVIVRVMLPGEMVSELAEKQQISSIPLQFFPGFVRSSQLIVFTVGSPRA